MILAPLLEEPKAPPKSDSEIVREAVVGYWRDSPEVPASAVCRAFGISRATLFRWADELRKS